MARLYFSIILVNLVTLFLSANNPEETVFPFVSVLGMYLLSALVILFFRFDRHKNDLFTERVEKIIQNGERTIFIAGLGVFDIILFSLLAQDLIVFLEEILMVPFIFFSVFFFFVPVIALKIFVESPGKDLENIFWNNFRQRLLSPQMDQDSIVLSNSFSVYVLNQIQTQTDRSQRKTNNFSTPSTLQDKNSTDIITLTTYHTDSNITLENKQNENRKQKIRNFDPTTPEEEEFDPYASYQEELCSWFPVLASYFDKNPVSLRFQLFIDIIIQKTLKDPEVFQTLQSMSFSHTNN